MNKLWLSSSASESNAFYDNGNIKFMSIVVLAAAEKKTRVIYIDLGRIFFGALWN